MELSGFISVMAQSLSLLKSTCFFLWGFLNTFTHHSSWYAILNAADMVLKSDAKVFFKFQWILLILSY